MTSGTPAPSPPGKSVPRDRWLPVLLLAGLVLWQLGPMISPPFFGQAILGTDSYRSHDWLEVAKFDHYARISLLEWGRWPLWNPLVAGGLPQFAHPSDGSAGPLFLSSLILGEIAGMKANILLVALLGTWGVFALLRGLLRLSPSSAFVGAACYAGSGWLASRVAVGFYESCLMAAWPAILALWLLPGPLHIRRRRWAAGALLLWALAIQLQLAVPVLVLLMVILAASLAVQDRLAGRPLDRTRLLGGALILGVAGLLGSIKFLPMLDLLDAGGFRSLSFYPTHPDAWYRSPGQFFYGLFHQVPASPLLDADGGPRVQEYMALVPGLGSLVLASLGLLLVLRRPGHSGRPWALVALLFLWLSFGPHAPVDLFRPLHNLPFFGSMRGPLRYLNYPVLLGLCILAGLGFSLLESRLSSITQQKGGRWPWLLPAMALAVIALNLPGALESRSLFRSSFLYGLEELPATTNHESEGLSSRSSNRTPHVNLRKYANVRRNVPTIYLPEDLPIDVRALPEVWVAGDGSLRREPGYRGRVRVEPEGAGRAEVLSWRGQVLQIRHDLSQPARVVLNANSWEGWRCEGRQIQSARGLLAFGAPAGQEGVTTCTWRPRRLAHGAALSLAGLLGLFGLWPWRSRHPGRRK